ncbi:SNF2-related protein [Halococcus sediminicola]|uniref:SNF2-related protein n=1 Tax=Halococcus sediminicola TaxID=1264579 RepID=UPI0006788304|nr:SNF2-related protein [Halococcus sediminicola]
MTRPEFVDNRAGNTLAAAISEYLEELDALLADKPDLDIASGYFNPGGYFSLAEGLDQVGRVRILLGAEPDEKDRKRWRKPGEPRKDKYDQQRVDSALQSLDENLERDRDLLGFSRETDDNLQTMIDFLNSERVDVRRYEDRFLHGKAFLFSHEQGVLAGSSNFTWAGLNSNLELNLGHYEPHVTEQVEDWFEDVWAESEPYDLAGIYEERFEPYEPYFIYLRVLWERYRDEIEQEREETEGAIQLTNFQNDGAFRAKRFLEEHNGVIIADEVGLGKTFIAGEILEETVQENRQKALVVAPAYLRDGMWKKQRANWNFHFTIVSYSQLRNDIRLGGSQDNLGQDLDEFQLIVVDEAHAFRNPNADQTHALRTLLRGDPPKDLVMLTATPVNNSLWDLYYLLNTFIKNDAAFASEGIPSLRERFKSAQAEDPSELSPEALFDVLDQTTVRRTRRFVKKYYPNETIPTPDGEIRITFPDVNPKRVDYTLNEAIGEDFFDDVARGLVEGENGEPELTLARYRISDYQIGEEDGSNLALVGLMRTGLLKRFESSRRAFAKTLGRMIEQYEATLDIVDSGRVPNSEAIDEWVESDNDEAFAEALSGGGVVDTASGSLYEDALKDDLRNDIKILKRWKRRAEAVSLGDDGKLSALHETLARVARQAEADAANDEEFRRNRKVLLFSYYEDTVDWILDYLDKAVEEDDRLACYRGRIAGVAGDSNKRGVSREQAVTGFAPESTDAPTDTEDEFDILVATDVLGQGVNLQQSRNVVNYDLPWNPMRVVQRNGRIDRINSKHSEIYAYSFFPEDRLDDLLKLEFRVREKLTQAAHSIGLDSEIFPESTTLEQNYADKREDIESIRQEKQEAVEQGGSGAAAYSGEEFRQELRRGLKDHEETIKSLPWGAGSGFRGPNPGYFFCARVGEKIFTRFLPLTAVGSGDETEALIEDTLSCLQRIECSHDTERALPVSMRNQVYDTWEIAREDIYNQWMEQTDPRNIEPEIRPLFIRVADHLREHPPDMLEGEFRELIESVEAPWGRRYERELRDIYDREIDPDEKTKELVEKIEDLGLQPSEPPEPLPLIEEEEVQLICWLAVAPHTP